MTNKKIYWADIQTHDGQNFSVIVEADHENDVSNETMQAACDAENNTWEDPVRVYTVEDIQVFSLRKKGVNDGLEAGSYYED